MQKKNDQKIKMEKGWNYKNIHQKLSLYFYQGYQWRDTLLLKVVMDREIQRRLYEDYGDQDYRESSGQPSAVIHTDITQNEEFT